MNNGHIYKWSKDNSTSKMEEKKFTCVCCGYKTLPNPPRYHDICEICFWESDDSSPDYPDEISSPNHISLIEAQKNFLKFGACTEDMIQYVRKPTQQDIHDSSWKSFGTPGDDCQ
jgi:Cysteine-rich CPCC